jgi:hypothetical protein
MLHQEKITAYKTFINFQSNFIVDQLIINDLIKDASIQRSSIQLNKNQEEFIKNRIKALIGRLAWGEIGMNYILNAKDLTFLKAVETLN